MSLKTGRKKRYDLCLCGSSANLNDFRTIQEQQQQQQHSLEENKDQEENENENENDPIVYPKDDEELDNDETLRQVSQENELKVNDVEIFTWEDLKCQGCLNKQDAAFPWLWRRRWFSLQGSRLLYYEVERKPNSSGYEKSPLGHIALGFVLLIDEDKNGRKNSFMISTADRVYHLQCDTAEDMYKWIETLRKAKLLFKRQERTSSILSSVSYNRKQYREGFLFELAIFKTWRQFYFILKDGVLFKYKNKGETQIGRIHLYGCKFEDYQWDSNEAETTSFRITSPSGQTSVLRATTFQEMHGWLNELLKQQIVIEEFINSIIF